MNPPNEILFHALGDFVRDPRTREALTLRENTQPWQAYIRIFKNLAACERCEEKGVECWMGDEVVGCGSCSENHQICSNTTRLQETMLRIKFGDGVEGSEAFMKEFLVLESTVTGGIDGTWDEIERIDKASRIPGASREWAVNHGRVLHFRMEADLVSLRLRNKSNMKTLQHIRGCATELKDALADPENCDMKGLLPGLTRIEELAKAALGI
ncbi:hypothetical protein BKA70DRAFT_1430553 [Coprinopsis sp. MPI-PUGE-AT-0042]|nr:hypothetical protein BKA70DRAFT_1227702 [Coprinopsis sp. MPI-PUGE-AT-0042]KAH6905689.1 hypothetical protein BKA70DRAFT_1430553 [Coprinopsis sp. MPI-PUGE-AT-0042]